MIITTVRDIQGKNINWAALGKRFRKFRESNNLSRSEVAEDLHLSENAVMRFEQEYHKNRVSTNIIWDISFQWNLSISWLLNGFGKPHDPDPVDLMPETLFVHKGLGIRKSYIRGQADEGSFSDHVSEFFVALDKFKRRHHISFPTLTQIYEIIIALGYRKSAPARIAPLGYIIEHQLEAEKLKQINEKPEIEGFIFSDQLPKLRPYKQGRYVCIDPQRGKRHIVSNLSKFCRERQLPITYMKAVICKQQKNYNGWRAYLIVKPFMLGKTTVFPIDSVPKLPKLPKVLKGL